MPTVLVTGANRGIGLEFARQYAARGWHVIATCRDRSRADELNAIARAHPSVQVETLDLCRDEDIASLAARLKDVSIDILLNNAALLGPGDEQILGQWTRGSLNAHFQSNAAGPMLLTQALLPAVERSEQRKIVFLGSAAGCTALLNLPANLYSYRASKAALHLLARNLSLELKERDITVAIINPGLTDTRGLLDLPPDDPGPPDLRHVVALARAGKLPIIRTGESVEAMIALVDAWSPDRSGEFLNYDGQPMPW